MARRLRHFRLIYVLLCGGLQALLGSMGQTFDPLTPDQQLRASALEVARLHGEHAYHHASARVACLEAEGNHSGAMIWRAILWRLEALAEQPSRLCLR